MTSPARRVLLTGLIALAVSAGCRSSERQAAEAARNSSQTAATAEQKQLWQDAADNGAPGLERVPVPSEPVRPRARVQVPAGQSKPQPVEIPKGVRSEIRILTYPKDPFASYMGQATVGAAAGETIPLDLGAAGTLTLLVRAGDRRLPLKQNDVVDVWYQVSKDPDVPDDVIAIRMRNGGPGIAHVVRGESKLVQFTVPLFDVTAVQQDGQGLPVSISVPAFKDKAMTFTTGETKSVDTNVMALVVGSTRFTLNVLVWSNP